MNCDSRPAQCERPPAPDGGVGEQRRSPPSLGTILPGCSGVTDEACPARNQRSRVGLAVQRWSGRSGEMDTVPGLGPVDAGSRLAGIQGRSQLVLDLRQSTAQVGVLHLQVGDPLLEGGDEGQEGSLRLGWDRVPEWCGDWRLRNHTLYYEAAVQRVRPWDGSGRHKNPERQRTNCLT